MIIIRNTTKLFLIICKFIIDPMDKKVVSVRLKEDLVDLIDELVRSGYYPSRKDFVLQAVKDFLDSHAR